MDELLEAISKEKDNRFNKPWNKLGKGLKLNRLNDFVDKYECIDDDKILLKALLTKSLNNNNLKNDHINYDHANNNILNIENLSYDDGVFTLDNVVKKTKPKVRSKTKTNIERHFNRSKKSDTKTL
jgi:hypothetical protein